MASSPTLTVPAGRKARATHGALLRATKEVIASEGGFSGEQVAEKAGMSAATFYTYFPSKDEALAAVLDEVLAELVDRTLAELDVERLLEDGLEPVVRRAVLAALRVFSTSAVALRLAIARLPESPSIRRVYRDHQRRALDALERFVRLGTAAGKLSAPGVEGTAIAFLAALQGLNNPMLFNRKPKDPALVQIAGSLVHLLDPEHRTA